MAKAPADTVKYNIFAEITIDGVVEQPDVVGAIFGQSEGLLGEDLELRDLQKTGRIGRIEVDIGSKVGKSSGTVFLPMETVGFLGGVAAMSDAFKSKKEEKKKDSKEKK